MIRANLFSNILYILILSSFNLACEPDISQKNAIAANSMSSLNETSIIGTWKNNECTHSPNDKDIGAQKELWYHETLTITETTFDSVNTYFVDANCTQEDSYQPSATDGGLLSYHLGEVFLGNSRMIDFTPNAPGPAIYTIVDLTNNQLRFGAAKDANEDGKSAQSRLTQISKRAFTRVDILK